MGSTEQMRGLNHRQRGSDPLVAAAHVGHHRQLTARHSRIRSGGGNSDHLLRCIWTVRQMPAHTQTIVSSEPLAGDTGVYTDNLV